MFGSQQWMYSSGAAAYEIDQSLRFNDNDSAYLNRTPSSLGNRRIWTWSGWFKRGNVNSSATRGILFSSRNDGSNYTYIGFDDGAGGYDRIRAYSLSGSSVQYDLESNAQYRDVSAWYHLVVSVDTTDTAPQNRVKVYINGAQITDWATSTYPSQEAETLVNATYSHRLGQMNNGSYFDGYMADVHFVDGQQLTPDYFGEIDETYGHWKPKEVDISTTPEQSYGTNGFYLDFDGTYYNDKSDNANHFTANNFSTFDVMPDSPTNNFCVMNPLARGELNGGAQDISISQGGLQLNGSTGVTRGTMLIPKTGKWYWEAKHGQYSASGIVSYNMPSSNSASGHTVQYYTNAGNVDTKTNGGTFTTTYDGPSASSGEIIGIALDMDNSTIKFYRNNSLIYTQATTVNGSDDQFIPSSGFASSSETILNFGQDSSFSGTKTAQNNADGNGIGDFYYTPPSGYKTLCTKNLPEPTVVPGEQFNTILYGGNGGSQSITGVGFSPNLVWVKNRTASQNHRVWDTNRGTNKALRTNYADAEYTGPLTSLSSFGSDGFTMGGSDADWNGGGANYVAWNWNASGSTSSNTDGTGITSTVDVNSDAGFSIATYTGTGSSGSTVGHGLSQAPEFVVIKQRDGTGHWAVWHKDLGTGVNIALSSNSRAFTVVSETSNGGISTANSSVVSFQTGTSDVANVNVYDGTYVMYSWHSVDGYSKIGSYIGNGSSDGPFIHTGFRPAFILVKKHSTDNHNWYLHDTARDPVNPTDNFLEPNVIGAEGDGSANAIEFDIFSNGFKCVDTASQINYDGKGYIYIAFAEYPFKYSNARGTSLDKYVAPAQDYTIDQSIRFNDDDNCYLTRTPSGTGNRQKYTRSYWFKRGNLTGQEDYLNSITGSDADATLFETSDKLRFTLQANSYWLRTTQVFRDTSAWYHIVEAVDTTQATSSNRWKIYVNGVQITDFDNASYPTQNYNTKNNVSGNAQYIGMAAGNNNTFDGYLAEVHWIDGQALGPEHFGTTDETYGNWIPISYGDGNPEDDYGPNGFYLDFQSGALGTDRSGKGNNLSATNLSSTTDVVLDSPTNNFATWNVLANSNGDTFSEGNLKVATASSPYTWTPSSMGVSSGKVYAEFLIDSTSGYDQIGIATGVSTSTSTYLGATSESWGYTAYNGHVRTNDNSFGYGNTFTTDDIIGVAVDLDNGYIYWSKNGTWQNSGDPTSGSSGTGGVSISSISGKTIFFGYSDFDGAGTGTYVANFGQDSSFAGNKTAQGNTDGNSIGDFYYTPPSGYLALCTANLPTPAVVPRENFTVNLWTGNDTERSITTGFQPDLVWTKFRSVSSAHQLHDSVRGAAKIIYSNLTNAESSTNGLLSFDSNGFTMGNNATSHNMNGSGYTTVGWSWKAGGSSSSNTNGSITSTVSANQDAGFSIVSYTGNGTAGATVGHGLSQVPEMYMVKERSSADHWQVYHHNSHSTTPEDYYFYLSSDLPATDYNMWNDTAPTNQVFSLSSYGGGNQSSATYIAYCFHSVDGYSKVGYYTGNGVVANGPFVYTGFRPAFVLWKNASTNSSWVVIDNRRNDYNYGSYGTIKALFPNLTNAEDVNASGMMLMSNGFKIYQTGAGINNSGNKFVYIAFAENPFKHTNAR